MQSGRFAIRIAFAFVCCSLILGGFGAAIAQDDALVVPFTPIPPFMQFDENGARTGFIVELSELIGEELGIPIEYLDVANSREFVAAQSSGDTQLIAGILRLPALSETNVFSDPVATDALRPAILAARVDELGQVPLEGRRIGVVPPAEGSKEPILEQNQVFEFNNPQTAILKLLSDDLDAILLPTPVVYNIARDAGLDGRIAFIGDPLKEANRHVALHSSRSDLLAPINAFLAEIESDGRLEALRHRYHISVPPLPPEVLTVGFSVFPPYKDVDENGEATGFSVETMRRLADRAGLDIVFKQISQEEWVRGPVAGEFDMMTLANITPEKQERMDFTLPTVEASLSIFQRRDAPRRVAGLDDLAGQKVGVVGNDLAASLAQAHGQLELVYFDNQTELMDGLLENAVSAVLFNTQNFSSMASDRDVTDQIRRVEPPFHETRAAPALRLGLGSVRDRLNATIPGFFLSNEYTELRDQYFGEPVFWTQSRIMWALLAAGSLAAISLGALVIQTMRARANAAIAVVKDELETIFNAATSGIIAFDKDGQIVRINARARHFLGGLSDPVPFMWPTNIVFIDVEDLRPLAKSADPIQRALAGAELHHATHLMNRTQRGEDRRYVRLESTSIDREGTDARTVIVLDDISNEERNRQVVERKGRLEALGQLTGGIAHDFNNILTTLMTSIFLAGRAKDAEGREKQLKVAEGSVMRARSLTSRLMAFAKKQPGLAESARVSSVLDNLHGLVRPTIEETIHLEVGLSDPDLLVYCELAQLESALLNLVLNSRDAILRTGKGNRVTLNARAVPSLEEQSPLSKKGSPSDRYIEISVTDNGPGMEEEVVARATDPFFTTKDTNSGTGLGLSMVYGFARQSDGDLRIYSEEGVGTTVQLTLPRGTDQGSRESPMEADEIIMGQGQTILLAEDELELLRATKNLLEEFGYKVVAASSGIEALEYVTSGEPFDLLLTDVVMPGTIGGFKLAEKMREVTDAPVVYFSGYTGYSEAEMGQVPGVLLQKPAVPSEMSRAIASALKLRD